MVQRSGRRHHRHGPANRPENTDYWQQALNGASRLQGSSRAFFRDTEDAVMKEHEETESEGEASDADVVMVTDDETALNWLRRRSFSSYPMDQKNISNNCSSVNLSKQCKQFRAFRINLKRQMLPRARMLLGANIPKN